jgi:hypothetical protein
VSEHLAGHRSSHGTPVGGLDAGSPVCFDGDMGSNNVIDMGTAAGCAEWMRTLPSENLRSIAARPVFVCEAGSNALLVASAEAELIVRGER